MKITKEIAQKVAAKMVEKKQEKINALKEKFTDVLDDFLSNHVFKKQLMTELEKNNEYICFSGNIILYGCGFNGFYCHAKNKYPHKKNAYRVVINFHDLNKLTEGSILNNLNNEIEKKQKQLRELITELENTIYNLKSLKNANLHFAVCVPFLLQFENKNTSIAVNFTSIIEKLKPEITE